MRTTLRRYLGVDIHGDRLDQLDHWRQSLEERIDRRNEELKATLAEINTAVERLYSLIESLQHERNTLYRFITDAVSDGIKAGRSEA